MTFWHKSPSLSQVLTYQLDLIESELPLRYSCLAAFTEASCYDVKLSLPRYIAAYILLNIELIAKRQWIIIAEPSQ